MTGLGRLAEGIARREAEWAWDNIDPELRATFTDRLAARLPRLNPTIEWESMPLRYRREWAWHLSRTPAEHEEATAEDVHRLQMEADDATRDVFMAITGVERTATIP